MLKVSKVIVKQHSFILACGIFTHNNFGNRTLVAKSRTRYCIAIPILCNTLTNKSVFMVIQLEMPSILAQHGCFNIVMIIFRVALKLP